MRALKFEWREGPHGVDSLKIVGERGIFTFRPNPSSVFDTQEHPFNRAAALEVVKAMADELLKRLAQGHHLESTRPPQATAHQFRSDLTRSAG